ncbi:MAG: hypothetical protein FJY95_03200 [Candidatus Handelsmanbacteria bacterium]|nr:hypothetical protein [Candidatus Handelsmanbacteria bacterium]
MVGAERDILEVLVLAFVQGISGLSQQNAGLADDGVHRGAQVVGHAREVLGLVLIGLLDLGIGRFEGAVLRFDLLVKLKEVGSPRRGPGDTELLRDGPGASVDDPVAFFVD